MSHDFETYQSPFTWRYGSHEMRSIWSLAHKRRLWRRVWVALAEVQMQVGMVTQEQVEDLRTHQNNVDLDRAHELERELRHDLMAEIMTYAEQCQVGGGIIHLGATSMDIEDNADALRIRAALQLVVQKLSELLAELSGLIRREANHACMAFTHIQPAEPTTVGYRLAMYGHDLLADLQILTELTRNIRGKGFKGAVGTSASYAELLNDTDITPDDFEASIMKLLDLEAFEIATQTYPRRQDWEVVSALAGLSMTIYKFAFDLRILQSPPFGEWAEPFGQYQVGSSAMPFKRNPINAENMNSLARYVASLPRVLWDNAAHSLLERTLDDSGNRRIVIPEAFLAVDELLKRMLRLVRGLRIDDRAVKRNFDTYGVFAATERLLMEVAKRGGSRQDCHELIRQHSLIAWEALRDGKPNPLVDLLSQDEWVSQYVGEEEARALLDASAHIGNAPEKALKLAKKIDAVLKSGGEV